MLDISLKHKQHLNPHLERIKQLISEKSKRESRGRDIVWTYLRYLGPHLVMACGLDANLKMENRIRLRDWLIVISDGLFMNIARKLKIRMALPNPLAHTEIGFRAYYSILKRKELTDIPELDQRIENLTKIITSISREEPNDIAFVRLCNYSLTTLGPLLIMDVYGEDFNHELIQFLCFFWTKVAEDLYEENAVSYEIAQILNGNDCEIFTKLEERLKTTGTLL